MTKLETRLLDMTAELIKIVTKLDVVTAGLHDFKTALRTYSVAV